MALARQLSDQMLSEEPGVVFMRRALGAAGGKVAFRFRAIPASAAQARALGTKRGAPLLSSEHTYFDANEAAVLHGTVLFRGDRYDFGLRAPVRGDTARRDTES
jgi:DNA-binding GntR family transcriptional regulator